MTIMGYGYNESCRELFKELKILTLSLQYIFSLLLFIVNNRNYFVSNSVYHKINTRQKKKKDLTCLRYILPCIRRVFIYSGTKFFNCLPKAIKDISSKTKKFKIALKHYLLTCSFYSLDEVFSIQ